MASVELHPCPVDGLTERLAQRSDEATDAIVPVVLGEIPHYRTLTPDQLLDVQNMVRAGYLAALALWAAGRPANPDQLRPFRANGATRAAEGRPLPVVLRAYRVSALAIYDFVIEQTSGLLDAGQERNFARIVMTFVDQLSNEVTIGYVETTGQLANQQGRARRELLEDLLAGRLLGAVELSERAATLGLALPARPSLLVVAPDAREGSALAERAQVLLREIAATRASSPESGPPLQLITRGHLVVIDELPDAATVGRALAAGDLTGVMLDVADLTDVATAYQDAREIHDLLREARVPAARLVEHDEAQLLVLLARSRRDDRCPGAVTATLRDLLLPQHAALVETLDVYLRIGNAVSAAHALGVHAQTMRYRLKRVRELTGRDPAHGWDRFVLELALRLSRA